VLSVRWQYAARERALRYLMLFDVYYFSLLMMTRYATTFYAAADARCLMSSFTLYAAIFDACSFYLLPLFLSRCRAVIRWRAYGVTPRCCMR